MTVLTFSREQFNYIVGQRDDYFLLSGRGQVPLLVRNRCPHRGGPLHLGELDALGQRLVCPWHGTAVGEAALRRLSLPLIARNDTITVVLDDSDNGLMPTRRIVLANQPCGPLQESCAPGHAIPTPDHDPGVAFP